MKASDGYVMDFKAENQFIDKEFEETTKTAISANLLVGSYHYFAADNTVQAQVDNFLEQIEKVNVQNLPPVLDLEDHPNGERLLADYQKRVIEWLEKVEAATGMQPIVYSAKSFYDTYLDNEVINTYPLWIANYTSRPEPAMPKSRSLWTFWQYSAKDNGLGKKYGVWSTDVDLNRYLGDTGELLEAYGDNWKRGENDPLIKLTYLREEYERFVQVIPPWANDAEQNYIIGIGKVAKNTFMYSYDDAGASPVENNTAVLWDIADTNKQGFTLWFAHWYPKTKVVFQEYPAGLQRMGPEQLAGAIRLTLSNMFTQGK